MQKKNESYKLFLKLADSLEATDKIMALCCRMYYAEKVIAEKRQSGTGTTPAEQEELTRLFDLIETGKKSYELSKDGMITHIEDFCAKMYNNLNKEDRTAPKITKELAKNFNTLGCYIELLGFYNMLTSQWEEISNLLLES